MQQRQVAGARLSCRDFLEGHTEYLDGALEDSTAQRFDAHVRDCKRCERYDHVLRRGLFVARNLPEVYPSEHFHERLQARLMQIDADGLQQPIVAGPAALVMIAAVLAFIAITPLLRLADRESAVPAPAVSGPVVPFSFAPAGASPLPGLIESKSLPALLPAAEPSFSPVVVLPPAVQPVSSASRLISYPLQQHTTR
jgi:hypothetical protein